MGDFYMYMFVFLVCCLAAVVCLYFTVTKNIDFLLIFAFIFLAVAGAFLCIVITVYFKNVSTSAVTMVEFGKKFEGIGNRLLT